MLPWIHLATATAPGGNTLKLLRRGDEFSIRLAGGNELMNSRLGGSEEALATLALARVADRPAPRLLIGGLGMGFTLRAAQAVAPPDARLIVSEIVSDLVGWAGQHMEAVFGDCLSDPRVDVKTGDVGAEIRQAAGAFDAILLDVDNGPDGLSRADNDLLYGEDGLRASRQALAPGGVLAVWSAAPDPAFSKRLSRCGFGVSTRTLRAGRAKGGHRHTSGSQFELEIDKSRTSPPRARDHGRPSRR
jgi:spermidine synthase